MRTFDSRHYIVVGWGRVSEPTRELVCWVLRSRSLTLLEDETTYLVTEAKFVDSGLVYFLKKDGSVENKQRKKIKLPKD